MSSIRIRIDNFRKILTENKDSFTVYKIDVWINSQYSHSVEHRYSEFEDLHKKISKIILVQKFPSKSMRKWSSKTIENRKYQFENYLKYALDQFQFGAPTDLLEFLECSRTDFQRRFPTKSVSSLRCDQFMTPFSVSISEVEHYGDGIICAGIFDALYSRR